jgi:hypothetical protein
MNERESVPQSYMVSVAAVGGAPGAYTVSYVTRGLQPDRGPGGKPKRVRSLEYRAHVQPGEDQPVRWQKPPAEGEALAKFDADARERAALLNSWIENLNRLIGAVRTWAEELGWSTKVIDKPMEDSAIGQYRAPALLLQEAATKVLLEPIARTAPGAEGVVDLYLMPGYDDIASLYYYGNRWNLHYMAEGRTVAENVREAEAKPLSKSSLRKVLEELKSHAG